MKKNLAILLLICLCAITTTAASTSDAVENLNRRLPLDSSTDRLLSKVLYDEVNNIVVANYYTSWKNLVQMRKTPDFSKRAGQEVLENIFLEDSAVKPFTLIVNYFADESGFEDLSKTYFVSPGEVANAQKTFAKNIKGNSNNKAQQQPSVQAQKQIAESNTPSATTKDQQLHLIATRLADFKGFTDPQGSFQIAQYALAKNKQDINIVVIAKEDALPFFTDERNAATLENTMSRLLSKQFPDLENSFNTLGLNVAIYTADDKGQIKGQYKYPASRVFANKAATPEVSNGNGKQPLAQVQTPAQQTSVTPTVQPQKAQSNTKKNATVEDSFQALLKLYQALLPQKIDEGIKITHAKSNEGNLMLVVDVDGEKYPESTLEQIREIIMKHMVKEFGKKKSSIPLLLTFCCQTSRQFTFVICSKSWKSTYPLSFEPCGIIQTLKSKTGK